jgi:hypothetical protein
VEWLLLRLVFVLEPCDSAVEGGEHKKAEWSVRRESRRAWKREERSGILKKRERGKKRTGARSGETLREGSMTCGPS